MKIHSTAVISPEAELDPSVEVGPYVVIEGRVRIGPESRILSHACLFGDTEIGERTLVHPFATIGNAPQDLSYRGEKTTLRIGSGNTFREGCSIHRGTVSGGGTVIGNDGFFMSCSHVGHDSRVGNSVIMANGALLGGHVRLGDHVFLSGNVIIHQFCRIGEHAILGGGSAYSKDVPPFCTGATRGVNEVAGLNVIGLRRSGFSLEEREEIKSVYRVIYNSGLNVSQALEELGKRKLGPRAAAMVEFVRTSKRGICRQSSRRRD